MSRACVAQLRFQDGFRQPVCCWVGLSSCSLFGLGCPSAGTRCVDQVSMPDSDLWGVRSDGCSRSLCHPCPCAQSEPQPPPRLPETPWSSRRVCPRSCGLCFAGSVPGSPCGPSASGVPSPPSPVDSCTQAPLAFKARCSGGGSSQRRTPGWGADVGRGTLTVVRESVIVLQRLGRCPSRSRRGIRLQ